MKRSWLFLALPLVLAGCRPSAGPEVYLAPGVPFRLCPPQDGPDLFLTQEVVFRLPGGAEEIALATLENHAGGFSVVASSPLGQTLFVVRMQGAQVTAENRIAIPGDLDPRVLPGLVQFALWPAAAVRRGLGPEVILEEDGLTRRLLRKGRVVWTVTRSEGEPPRQLVLDNPALRLNVRIRTLEEAP